VLPKAERADRGLILKVFLPTGEATELVLLTSWPFLMKQMEFLVVLSLNLGGF